MKYNHRWYYVALIIIATIVLLAFTSVASVRHLFELKSTVFILEQKLAVLSRTAPASMLERQADVGDKQLTSYTVLPAITELAALSGLHVEAAKLMAPILPTIKHWKVHINIRGTYRQIADYLTVLDAQPYTVLLINFSYRLAEQHYLNLDAELVVLANQVKIVTQHLVEGRNPFCDSSGTVVTSQSAINESTVFQRQQLRMVGFYHMGGERQALIQLPNNHVVAVKVGDKVGSDGGAVAEINQSMMVVSSGRERQVMTMRSRNE